MRKAAWPWLLEATGAALVVAGLALFALPAALVVAGLFLIVASTAVGSDGRVGDVRPVRTGRRPGRRVA